MKKEKRILSMLIALVMLLGLFPVNNLSASSKLGIDDYDNVTVLAQNGASILADLSSGISFSIGTDYATITTTVGGDPYVTVDLKDVVLKDKVIAIKYRGTAGKKIANDWIYFNTSAGGWGPEGGGMLTTSKLVCNDAWQLTSYNINTELTGSGDNVVNQSNATVYDIRIGGVSSQGGVLDIAYVGIFDSVSEAENYDKLFCKAYTKVDLGKVESFPPAIDNINPESYNFNFPVLSNGLSLTDTPYNDGDNIINHFRRTWTPKKGTGQSCYVNVGTNSYYLKLQFDSLIHNSVYTSNTAYEFSADVMPADMANHFAGFMFNFGYENSWENNMFYETNGVNGNASVGQSGIGLNIYPKAIEVFVLRYDETDGKLKQISYTYEMATSIGDSFHKIKVIDGANGRISFYLDGVLFAYVEYFDAGLLPVSVTNYNEGYYRTATIYNSKGEIQAMATDALIAKVKTIGMGSRSRVLNIDNVSLKKSANPLKINGAYLSFSSEICMNFVAKKSEIDKYGYSDVELLLNFDGASHTIQPVENIVGGEECYVFKFDNLLPNMMNDDCYAVLRAKLDGITHKSAGISYNMADYLYRSLSNNVESIPRKMFVDLINYGAVTQEYTDYNIDNLVNADLSSGQLFWGTQTHRQYDDVSEIQNTNSIDDAIWKAMSMGLNSKISIIGYFYAENTEGYYVEARDENGTLLNVFYDNMLSQVTGSDGKTWMRFVFDNLNPTELSDKFNFVVYNNKGVAVSDTIVYSIESYASRKDDSSNEKLVNLVHAVMNYGDSTKEYVEFIKTPQYTVKFVDYDGTLLKTQKVYAGGAATAPSVGDRTDYVFNGWDKDYTNVNSNLKVTAQYGFTLTDEGLRARIIAAAEKITAFARDNGFIYGNPGINPAMNWKFFDVNKAMNPKERLVACDRLMSWTLYEAGFTDQPSYYGCDVSLYGFQTINSQTDLWPGDIVFVETDSNHPGTDHVFIIGSYNLGNNIYLRYDHGSNARIKCVTGTEQTPGKQPFVEGIVGFAYALRPSVSKLPPESVGVMQKNPTPENIAYPNSEGTVLATASDWCASTSGTGQQNMNYKYTIGTGYDQYQFETMLNVCGAVDSNVWNSCFVGARLPSLSQTPATTGGIWVAFKETGYAYVYSGVHPQTGNWNTTPLASIKLPEDVTTGLPINIATSAKKLTVVDAGDSIKYYLESAGINYLICTINVNVATSRVAIFDHRGTLKYANQISIGSSGYFMIFAHGNYCNAVGSKLKGCDGVNMSY